MNQLESDWKKGEEVMKKIYEVGAEKYLSSLPGWQGVFLSSHDCAVCMDEGCAHKKMDTSKIPMAGSGILFPADSENERLEKVAALFKNLGVKKVTSHEGCGAAGLAFKRDFPGAEAGADAVDELAQDWAKKLAQKIGADFENISLAEMVRPAGYHVARVAYYDGTGSFNPDLVEGAPLGFVISRKNLPANYALQELKVALSIAFGHHGFGELFSADDPFVIIILGGEIETYKKEISQALADDVNFSSGKIKIESAQ